MTGWTPSAGVAIHTTRRTVVRPRNIHVAAAAPPRRASDGNADASPRVQPLRRRRAKSAKAFVKLGGSKGDLQNDLVKGHVWLLDGETDAEMPWSKHPFFWKAKAGKAAAKAEAGKAAAKAEAGKTEAKSEAGKAEAKSEAGKAAAG